MTSRPCTVRYIAASLFTNLVFYLTFHLSLVQRCNTAMIEIDGIFLTGPAAEQGSNSDFRTVRVVRFLILSMMRAEAPLYSTTRTGSSAHNAVIAPRTISCGKYRHTAIPARLYLSTLPIRLPTSHDLASSLRYFRQNLPPSRILPIYGDIMNSQKRTELKIFRLRWA